MQQRAAIFALLALLTLPRLCMAAAWTLPQDKWELYQNAFYYRTTEFFDVAGDKQPQPAYTKYELNPYVEYGWRDGTTLGASLALDAVNGSTLAGNGVSLSGTNYGVGDPTLFLRQQLWQNDSMVVSVQPLIKLPGYYTDDLLPRSGTTQSDGELRLLGGYGFAFFGQNHFIDLEAAYRKRMGDPGDQLRFDATLGLTLNEKWQLLPQLSLIHALNSAANPAFTQSNEDDYDLVKPQFSAVFRLNDTTALQAGLFQHLSGHNTGAGGGGMLSLWYRP